MVDFWHLQTGLDGYRVFGCTPGIWGIKAPLESILPFTAPSPVPFGSGEDAPYKKSSCVSSTVAPGPFGVQ